MSVISFDLSFNYAVELIELSIESVVKAQAHHQPLSAVTRRSLSNCYYAVFHLTTVGGSCVLFDHEDIALVASRAFEHGNISSAYRKLNDDNINNPEHRLGRLFTKSDSSFKNLVSQTLRKKFNELHELRHEADYDFSLEVHEKLVENIDSIYDHIISASIYIHTFKYLKENFPDDCSVPHPLNNPWSPLSKSAGMNE